MVRNSTDFAERKQLEQEAILLGNNRSEDELAAAVGLLLFRYQVNFLPTNLIAQRTPTDKPINLQQRPSVACANRKRNSSIRTSHTPSVDYHKTECNSVYRNKSSANVTQTSSKRASLLNSCRNILKEFLSQNSSH